MNFVMYMRSSFLAYFTPLHSTVLSVNTRTVEPCSIVVESFENNKTIISQGDFADPSFLYFPPDISI